MKCVVLVLNVWIFHTDTFSWILQTLVQTRSFIYFIEDLLGHLNTWHCVPVLDISVGNSSSILDCMAAISTFSNSTSPTKPKAIRSIVRRPGRFPGIAGNAGNHGNDGKFHESHKILNQI